TYRAVELQIDRAWDEKRALNASYTLSWSRGNAEGPVNSDTNFDDAGRTENFDDPWVDHGGNRALPNDRRHQIRLRGTYGFNEHWRASATLTAMSGTPITGFGVGNPFDGSNYHSYYICVQFCDGPSEDRVYVHSPRGGEGRTSWTYDVGASIAWLTRIG